MPRSRRWFQFRLRTLLVAVLVLSLPLSWFAVRMQRARRQREAVEAVKSLGGSPCYAWELELDPFEPEPSWLRTLLGNDFFDSVTYVDFSGAEVTDAGLECLQGLPSLLTLDLSNTKITDAGLVHLAELRSLRALALDNTRVTAAGLECLEGRYLEWLSVRDTPGITVRGIERLKRELWYCKVED